MADGLEDLVSALGVEDWIPTQRIAAVQKRSSEDATVRRRT